MYESKFVRSSFITCSVLHKIAYVQHDVLGTFCRVRGDAGFSLYCTLPSSARNTTMSDKTVHVGLVVSAHCCLNFVMMSRNRVDANVS